MDLTRWPWNAISISARDVEISGFKLDEKVLDDIVWIPEKNLNRAKDLSASGKKFNINSPKLGEFYLKS